MSTSSVHFRLMTRKDVPAVCQLEKESFSGGGWRKSHFLQCVGQEEYAAMIGEMDGKIVSFVIAELHKEELQILNMAVLSSLRRTGIGSQMISRLKNRYVSCCRPRITLIVRETNLAAQLFFRSQGMVWNRTLRGYCRDNDEDAYHMVNSIAVHAHCSTT